MTSYWRDSVPNLLYRSAYENLRVQGLAFPFSLHQTLVDTRRVWSSLAGVDSLYDAAYGEYSAGRFVKKEEDS